MEELFLTYHLLVDAYPGWSLSDIKELPVPEREWWVSMALWKQKAMRSG